MAGGDPSQRSSGGAPPQGVALAIHGGAGGIGRAGLTEARRAVLTEALTVGLEILGAGGSALDAVEAAVMVLEDCPLFNAGRGSVLTADQTVELDAAVMDGAGRAGAVTGVRTVRNPVVLARAVMERTPHVLLAAEGAERLADEVGVQRVDPAWFLTDLRLDQLRRARETRGVHLDHGGGKLGTVGAVARDVRGGLAAATSTGGMVNKRPGRVGDTPIIGAGTWACNESCAVSATGQGEAFIRGAVGARIAAWMEMGGLSLQEAADRVVHGELQPGTGGVIAVDRHGHVALPFNSRGMLRGWVEDGVLRVEVE